MQAGPGDEMTFVFAACTTRVRLFGATVVLLLATPAVSAQDTSSQGGSITSDKPIYRFGEQVSITYATPNEVLSDKTGLVSNDALQSKTVSGASTCTRVCVSTTSSQARATGSSLS